MEQTPSVPNENPSAPYVKCLGPHARIRIAPEKCWDKPAPPRGSPRDLLLRRTLPIVLQAWKQASKSGAAAAAERYLRAAERIEGELHVVAMTIEIDKQPKQ